MSRSRLRAQFVALVGWAAGATALATALYPTLAAALFAFLAGVVMVITLRVSLRAGLAAASAAAVPFTFADLTLNALAASPAGSQQAAAALLLGLGLLLVSAAIASTVSASISRLLRASQRWSDTDIALGERRGVEERDAGLRRAEWELARAAEYRRDAALALVGIDLPEDGDDATTRMALLRRLDDLLVQGVSRFDVVCEFGPYERLMVLPEESATGLRDGASQICTLATERLGRRVRMALAGSPTHGTSIQALLTELESDLATCRTRNITVKVCSTAGQLPLEAALPGTAPRATDTQVARQEPLLILEPDEGIIEPVTGGTVMPA